MPPRFAGLTASDEALKIDFVRLLDGVEWPTASTILQAAARDPGEIPDPNRGQGAVAVFEGETAVGGHRRPANLLDPAAPSYLGSIGIPYPDSAPERSVESSSARAAGGIPSGSRRGGFDTRKSRRRDLAWRHFV